MSFYDRVGQFVEDVTDKTNDAIEIGRLNTRIHSERARIDRAKKSLGGYYYERFMAGAPTDEAAVEFARQIKQSEDQIALCRQEIEKLKEGFGPKSEKPQEDPFAFDGQLCGNCGKRSPAEANYCQHCGEALETREEG